MTINNDYTSVFLLILLGLVFFILGANGLLSDYYKKEIAIEAIRGGLVQTVKDGKVIWVLLETDYN
jgi:hypothetical protein